MATRFAWKYSILVLQCPQYRRFKAELVIFAQLVYIHLMHLTEFKLKVLRKVRMKVQHDAAE